MAKVHFNVDAYTARLIGRENVSKLNGAVLELVKNTYDADATICFLYYDDKSQTLYIGDNGCGMTADIIMKHWMTIGHSSKKKRYRSDSGRIQTGAKGIGRFALDRIADQCQMLTVSDQGRYLWSVDWRTFESEGTITDVTADLDETPLSFSEFIDTSSNQAVKGLVNERFNQFGTVFKLTLLRDDWNNKLIEDIKNELATLIPFELSNSFNIYVFDNTTAIESALVLHDNDAFSYDYKIEFDISGDGDTKIIIWRNEFDFKDQFSYVMDNAGFNEQDRKYFTGTPITIQTTFSEVLTKDRNKLDNNIGNFYGVMYFAKLQIPASEKAKYYYKDVTGRKDFRDVFGGIKIYRDNFRVRPYGDPKTSNYDWLQLAGRKNRSPASVSHKSGAWRVSADQMLGSIFISRTNLTLPDQANREGIVETREFTQLKECLLSILQYMERDRQYVCRKLSDLYERDTQTEQFIAEIEEKAAPPTTSSDDAVHYVAAMVEASKAKQVIDYKDEIIKSLEDENRMLRVLATTGIATNTYIHEFKDLTHRLNMKIVMAKEALELDNDSEGALKQILQADRIRNSFNSWFLVTIESVRRDKRSLKKIDLNEFLTQIRNAWMQVIAGKGIDIYCDVPTNPIYFRCFPYEIEIVLSNLITNSVSVLTDISQSDKHIDIGLSIQADNIVIDYKDNGPGLSSTYKENPDLILEAFQSDKTNELGETIGTGMGMWIIKRTLSEYNGIIDLSKNKSTPNGFYFTAILPRNC